jgi:hypothetical protein
LTAADDVVERGGGAGATWADRHRRRKVSEWQGLVDGCTWIDRDERSSGRVMEALRETSKRPSQRERVTERENELKDGEYWFERRCVTDEATDGRVRLKG